MPALKKLVDHYKGKDIEFVSISIDSEKDYEKWRKMVPEKDVGGIQLYDPEGLNSSFMRSFSVGLIPRFMMIDRDGKIITAHAPRPTSKGIKKYIDSHLNDDEMFRYCRAYRNLVVENFRHSSKEALSKDVGIDIVDFVRDRIKKISSLDIKEQFASMLIRQMKESNSNIDKDYIRIDSLLSTDRMKDKLLLRYKSAKENTSGAIAVDFDYENFDGGRTSLKDLTGKIVYIDVWATWCGPCIKEMPALKELVGHYKGKDIEFVSISIDSEKDYEKWRKMVPEKDVGGIQLYDPEGLNSSFMRSFSVGLIPRFMMIDRDGKIITAHAPRPTSKGIKKYIDSHLNDDKPKVVKFKST